MDGWLVTLARILQHFRLRTLFDFPDFRAALVWSLAVSFSTFGVEDTAATAEPPAAVTMSHFSGLNKGARLFRRRSCLFVALSCTVARCTAIGGAGCSVFFSFCPSSCIRIRAKP